MLNLDKNVIEDFGKEWKEYNQINLNYEELEEIFNKYFEIFPFEMINKNSEGFDMGCGSGRWAKFISPKVKKLNCIEPSQDALKIAKINLAKFKNCKFENKDVMSNSIKNSSQDFGYSLGVLHHIPNTFLGLENCVKKLKKGAPFLLYLYYRFDNRPLWFKFVWKISNYLRKIISKLPFGLKVFITNNIALVIYLPLARFSLVLEKFNIDVSNIPISSYRNKSFYTMKTDSLDRFGTRLESRFTKLEIKQMMINAGLTSIKFSNNQPYWVAVGHKK